MSEQPTTPSPVDPEELEALVVRAAGEAVSMIPAPSELTVDADSQAEPPGDARAFSAEFTGTTSGTAILLATPEFLSALESSAEDASLIELLTPAVTAIAEAGGPSMPDETTESAPGEVAGIGEAAFVALTTADGAVAWVGLRITATSKNSEPPAQAHAPDAEHAEDDGSNVRMELLRGVEMVLSVEIGRTRMLVRDLLQLTPGAVVELDRTAGSPADLLVNGRLIARGEVVVIDEEFGLRITQLVTDEEHAAAQ